MLFYVYFTFLLFVLFTFFFLMRLLVRDLKHGSKINTLEKQDFLIGTEKSLPHKTLFRKKKKTPKKKKKDANKTHYS